MTITTKSDFRRHILAFLAKHGVEHALHEPERFIDDASGFFSLAELADTIQQLGKDGDFHLIVQLLATVEQCLDTGDTELVDALRFGTIETLVNLCCDTMPSAWVIPHMGPKSRMYAQNWMDVTGGGSLDEL